MRILALKREEFLKIAPPKKKQEKKRRKLYDSAVTFMLCKGTHTSNRFIENWFANCRLLFLNHLIITNSKDVLM